MVSVVIPEAEAEPLLISAYNGMKAREQSTPPGHESDLRTVVKQITVLCKEAGHLQNKAALDEIRADPQFQALVLDIQFPAEPFAPISSDPERQAIVFDLEFPAELFAP
jgi:hypothetical protein